MVHLKHTYFLMAMSVALMIALAPGAVALARYIETEYFPVAKNTHIEYVDIIESVENSILIWGHTEKVRDCRFEYITWYRGIRPIPSVRVRVEFEEPDQIRKPQLFKFGPWRLYMRWDTNAENPLTHTSFANVYHQCWAFGVRLPWLTKTKFYN